MLSFFHELETPGFFFSERETQLANNCMVCIGNPRIQRRILVLKEINSGEFENEWCRTILNIFEGNGSPKISMIEIFKFQKPFTRDVCSFWRDFVFCVRVPGRILRFLGPSENVSSLRARGPTIRISTPAARLEK